MNARFVRYQKLSSHPEEFVTSRTSSGSNLAASIRREDAQELFLLIATWLSLTGWILSALGSLNATGYLGSGALGLALLGLWSRFRSGTEPGVHRSIMKTWRSRFGKPLPALYLTTFVLAALGGMLHPPNNFDALTYRLPQLLHWLDAGRWHWIATSNEHLNITGAGYSWLMAPLLALTGSDRGFFLPNIIAYAFLPGAFFQVARGCGVRRRVAWYWMWLLASGYCFAIQAGGIANDLLPATYVLVAVGLAFRARRTGVVRDAWFSILAAALATGVKVVVLPLGLPWLVALWPNWRLLARRPFATIVVALVGLTVSYLPTAILNTRHGGDWTGDPANKTQLRIDYPLYGLAGNALQIVAVNCAPPIWPVPDLVNAPLARFMESPEGKAIRAHYRRFDLRWFELVAEDCAGVGLGIAILMGVSVVGTWVKPEKYRKNSIQPLAWVLCTASLLAALVYGMKMGSEAAPRLFASYYPFILIPFLLLPVSESLTRQRWWRALAWTCAATVVPTLVLTPARPLWPAHTVVAKLVESYPNSAFLHRANLVYDVFAARHDHLAPLKKYIPADALTVGFVPTGNDLEGSLWRPFGSHRVVEVLTPSRSDAAVRQLSGSVIVCSPRGLIDRFGMTVEEFCAAVGGHLIGEETFALKAVVGPERWIVIGIE